MLVVDDNPYCDREGAKRLIEFALPEVRTLSRRRTLGDVKETLLWCAYAWNLATGDTVWESLEKPITAAMLGSTSKTFFADGWTNTRRSTRSSVRFA